MRVTRVSLSSSAAHGRRVAAMSWHRRRIRRARRLRESAPQPLAAATPAPDAGRPSIRRLVVFVPRAPRSLRAVTPPVRPATSPRPA